MDGSSTAVSAPVGARAAVSGCAAVGWRPTVHVSPDGDDRAPGTSLSSSLSTLSAARDFARAVGSPLICVHEGVYRLKQTLELGEADAGVTWRADGDVRIHGGPRIAGWIPVEQNATGVHLVRAPAPPDAQDRHLFVNGRRATRTRMREAEAAALFNGANVTDDGFQLVAAPVGGARLPSGAELVYPQSTSPWTEPRCAVVRANATFVEMAQPCWRNLVHKACGQGAKGPPVRINASSFTRAHPTSAVLRPRAIGAPTEGRGYVENVGWEAIRAVGEWALGTDGYIYYAPRDADGEVGEAIGLEAVMPELEVLVRIKGTANVSFSGFAFEYATWRRPSGGEGFVEQQAGCAPLGDDPRNHDCDADEVWSWKTPGNVRVVSSQSIAFLGCRFAHLGGVALDLTSSSECKIEGCVLRDISASAIQIGGFRDPRGAWRDRGNTVRDCLIEGAAAEFSGAVGVNVGYTVGTVVEHNTLHALSFSAISVGWGWNRHACAGCSDSRDNLVHANRIQDYKRRLNDGGAIYMLGPQNGSLVSDNYISHQGTASCGALYPDEGSAYSRWRRNVVTDIGNSSWLHIWTPTIHNVTVEANYADTPRLLNAGMDCPMLDNVVFEPGRPPPEARVIMRAAGTRWGTSRKVRSESEPRPANAAVA